MRKTSIPPLLLGAFLSLLLIAPLPGQTAAPHPGRPGTINYVEGQASIENTPLTPSTAAGQELARNQCLTTRAGKVEILLAPGIFLRLAGNSSLTMVSPDLANIEVRLEKGRAMVEVLDIHKENSILIDQNGAATKLLKKGLYDFDADHNEVRVFKGSAQVVAGDSRVKAGGKRKVALGNAPLKSVPFEPRQFEDDFYRWCALRSGYLSEASVDEAGDYIGSGPGWYAPGWYGWGWYWNPWFGAYTFLPPNGIYGTPFGWGYYSPLAVYRSPYRYYGHYPHGFGQLHYPYGHGFPPPAHAGRR
jgi:hypothetical protein